MKLITNLRIENSSKLMLKLFFKIINSLGYNFSSFFPTKLENCKKSLFLKVFLRSVIVSLQLQLTNLISRRNSTLKRKIYVFIFLPFIFYNKKCMWLKNKANKLLKYFQWIKTKLLKENQASCQASWHPPVIPAFRRLRQEEDEFKASLDYTMRLSQKQTNKQKQKQKKGN
jgi:hypothetical protein